MLTAERVLADIRRWGVELEVTSRPEHPLCLRVRFPDGMPDGLRRLVSRAVARRRFAITTLLATEGDEGAGQRPRGRLPQTGGHHEDTGAD